MIIVAGCGRGKGVRRLRNEGCEAYGFDRSIDRVKNAVSENVMYGDVTNPYVIQEVVDHFDPEEPRIDLIITERLLPCLTKKQATEACKHLRRHAPVKHIINPEHSELSLYEWQDLCDPRAKDEWCQALNPRVL